jgi:hypothetical protein
LELFVLELRYLHGRVSSFASAAIRVLEICNILSQILFFKSVCVNSLLSLIDAGPNKPQVFCLVELPDFGARRRLKNKASAQAIF